jgi:hypothetical protein
VVKQCSAETLFEDLLGGKARSRHELKKNTNLDLIKFVDKFLEQHHLTMTTEQFYKWRDECIKATRTKAVDKKTGNREAARKEKNIQLEQFTLKRKRYEALIKLAKEEWLLSTDGVVKALRYNAKEKQFVAKVSYQKGKATKEEIMILADDWVIDVYGNDIANKLIDHGEHEDYILPVDKDGKLATFKLDDRSIVRVKYVPPTFVHRYDEKSGCDRGVTDKVHTKGCWKGLLQDKTVVDLPEKEVEKQFGSPFLMECKRLGNRKFVPIPVGSCQSSVLELFPYLRCEKAPCIKYMQGQIDSCVLSSLASALDHTSIPDLVRVASILHQKSNIQSGGTKCLHTAKDIVVQNVKWLQPKRLPYNFKWEKDMNDYMFVVRVIHDSTNCQQHAVTIFRKWIFDSNEPFALPLCKASLDCCSFDIRDGKVHGTSSFVRFSDGWIFQELETKKKKVLDNVIAHSS